MWNRKRKNSSKGSEEFMRPLSILDIKRKLKDLNFRILLENSKETKNAVFVGFSVIVPNPVYDPLYPYDESAGMQKYQDLIIKSNGYPESSYIEGLSFSFCACDSFMFKCTRKYLIFPCAFLASCEVDSEGNVNCCTEDIIERISHYMYTFGAVYDIRRTN